jgi:hypothetical protein
MWFSVRFRLEAAAEEKKLKVFPLEDGPINVVPSQSAGPSSSWLIIKRNNRPSLLLVLPRGIPGSHFGN